MNEQLVEAAARAQVRLAGSILAWPSSERSSAAREMASRGIEVHADVIDSSFAQKNGVNPQDLLVLAAELGPCLDIHLLAEDPMTAIATLPEGPFDRLTVHMRARALGLFQRPLPRNRAAALWISIDPDDWKTMCLTSELRAILDIQEPDGILVMLTPAGVPNCSAQLKVLESDLWNLVAGRGPIGVDGGISDSNLQQAVAAGAQYAVAGRWLKASIW